MDVKPTKEHLYKIVGNNVRTLRKLRGYTHLDLATHLDLTRTSIVNIEKGRHGLSMESLIRISSLLDVEYNQILPHRVANKKAIDQIKKAQQQEDKKKKKIQSLKEQIQKVKSS